MISLLPLSECALSSSINVMQLYLITFHNLSPLSLTAFLLSARSPTGLPAYSFHFLFPCLFPLSLFSLWSIRIFTFSFPLSLPFSSLFVFPLVYSPIHHLISSFPVHHVTEIAPRTLLGYYRIHIL